MYQSVIVSRIPIMTNAMMTAEVRLVGDDPSGIVVRDFIGILHSRIQTVQPDLNLSSVRFTAQLVLPSF